MKRFKKIIAGFIVAIMLISSIPSVSISAPPPPIQIIRLIVVAIIAGIRITPIGPGGSASSPSFDSPSPPVQPGYYSFDDLTEALKEAKGNFYFDNSGPTGEMLADLPPVPPDASGGIGMAGKTRVQYLTLPWDSLPLRKGDVIFMRGNDSIGWGISNFSAFNHTAMVLSKPQYLCFESAGDGVRSYKPGEAWGKKVVTFAIKRIKNLSQWSIENAVDIAFNKYRGTPYFPNMPKSAMNRDNWLRKWMNKGDGESMYCSKLVWWTFSSKGLDLDTNFTKSWRYGNGRGEWMGVSPDDVYRSSNLARDYYIVGKENLRRRFESIL